MSQHSQDKPQLGVTSSARGFDYSSHIVLDLGNAHSHLLPKNVPEASKSITSTFQALIIAHGLLHFHSDVDVWISGILHEVDEIHRNVNR